ncbi:uncharacterized protein Tco025E_03841 [Trypanosoma conorhini]|uniref:Uncharacterized protein n=1 Tax=Trypanosoma conorhini TaxID=83891 RepID=A0A422PR94_9TRYP|nr:uncharacterized protein Tco025E_03841 [Trypanosoma conorhini]RNF20269.1 hypothetical protein Tco025E_03841 [Trypanosoma conorhini]
MGHRGKAGPPQRLLGRRVRQLPAVLRQRRMQVHPGAERKVHIRRPHRHKARLTRSRRQQRREERRLGVVAAQQCGVPQEQLGSGRECACRFVCRAPPHPRVRQQRERQGVGGVRACRPHRTVGQSQHNDRWINAQQLRRRALKPHKRLRAAFQLQRRRPRSRTGAEDELVHDSQVAGVVRAARRCVHAEHQWEATDARHRRR